MSVESPQVEPTTKKRSRSWFQLSLRTFLILMVVVGLIVSQGAREIAAALRRDAAITLLQSNGYDVYRDKENVGSGRWVTSVIPRSQWEKWFPRDWERLDFIRPRGITANSLSGRDLLRLLSNFESCQRIPLDFNSPNRHSISADDVMCFPGWRSIEELELDGGIPEESALRLLATSKKLKKVQIDNLHNYSRKKLLDFLNGSEIEVVRLRFDKFNADAPWRLGDSIKFVLMGHDVFFWDDAAELLANSRLQKAIFHLKSNSLSDANKKWNSDSLQELTLSGGDCTELDLLGDLPTLKKLVLRMDRVADLEALARLARYPSLSDLVYDSPFDESVIHEIAKITSLRRVWLKHKIRECSLDSIVSLRNLEKLETDLSLAQNDVAALRDLPALGEVNLVQHDLELIFCAPEGVQTLDVMTPLLDSRSLRTVSFTVEKTTPISDIDDFVRLAGERGILATVSMSVAPSPKTSAAPPKFFSSEPYLKLKKGTPLKAGTRMAPNNAKAILRIGSPGLQSGWSPWGL